MPTIIATAGWSINKKVASNFSQDGSGLTRYASVFDGVEVNSTFYRPHKQSTFERWADTVPDHFRFAVKLPRMITHDLKLSGIETEFESFLSMISPLESKLGPLLCQLPPSSAFDRRIATAAFSAIRAVFDGRFVIEPRHASWKDKEATDLLRHYGLDPVLADPAPVWPAADFPKPARYVRLHGKPKIYYSPYSDAEIRTFSGLLADDGWCVFDNTASGAAIENALTMVKDHGANPR